MLSIWREQGEGTRVNLLQKQSLSQFSVGSTSQASLSEGLETEVLEARRWIHSFLPHGSRVNTTQRARQKRFVQKNPLLKISPKVLLMCLGAYVQSTRIKYTL